MAVTSDFTLPAQPPAGTAIWHPLGGDGWIAPKAAFSVNQTLAMDASGGTATMTCRFDERFQNICVYVQTLTSALLAAVETEFSLVQRPTPPGLRARGFGTGLFMDTLGDDSLFTWSPPVLLNQDRVEAVLVNTTGGTTALFAFIYMFNIRVYEETPLNVLLQSIPQYERQNTVL